MPQNPDPRIPVVIGGQPAQGDAYLVEDGADMPETGYAVRFALGRAKPGHISACPCCTLRGPAADALTAMFRARATNTAPFFTRIMVLASPEGESAIRAALTDDVVTSARYRLA